MNSIFLLFMCLSASTQAFLPATTHIFAAKGQNDVKKKSSLLLSHEQTPESSIPLSGSPISDPEPFHIFPAISRLAGIEWTGSCRYVGADLVPVKKLKLSGGLRYDINGTAVTLSSFLTFPNGRTREVMMTGSKDVSSSSPTLTLRSVEEGGPIYMQITEVGSDTILINEIEEATGKTILTASLSIVGGSTGMELVQVSHEVGEGKQSIEGHQVWRLTGGPIQFDDFNFRDATGW